MRLNTFGRPHVARDGGEEVALQPLPLALLAYLAVGGPRDRTHLADLFWHNSKNSLNSLSTTLNRIRSEIPEAVWVQGNTLVGTDLRSDVVELREAIDASDFESIARLYDAPFLGSLKLRRQSVEFEQWVLDTRTTLASMVELALLQLGRARYEAGDYEVAAVAVEQAWQIAVRDGFPSVDYFETYHRILASAARPSANDVRAMADEFGVQLGPVEPIEFDLTTRSQPASAPDQAAIARDSPAAGIATTQLFGRHEELEVIASSVALHRLTTIVGLGGSGKTRLAIEFLNSSATEQDFPYRYFVNLRDVADHNLVGSVIAASLGQRYSGEDAIAESLPDDGPVLLVLDNFDHLLGAAGLVNDLLASHSSLKVVVTSRVPLDLVGESLVQLTGLDTSDDELDSPAEQLFASSARRAGVSTERLNGLSRMEIRQVCQRVGGNPLALEIAGGWALVLSPAEILDVLLGDSGLLGSPMQGGLRSMDAVLNQSWATLTDEEQRTLMLLATFPSGCLTKEALKLNELPIRAIGRLVQHSLARLHVEGRITLHPLIAGHALSQLQERPELHRDFQRVLSDWCQSFTASTPLRAGSSYPDRFDDEVANFASAWLWDAQRGQWEMHRTTLWPLRLFFSESGRVNEGRALFAATAESLRSAPTPPQDVLAAVLEAIAWLDLVAGELPQALVHIEEALALSDAENPAAKAQVLRTYGSIQLNIGDIAEAAENFEAGLALVGAESSGLTAALQYDLAQAHSYSGERQQAKDGARLALQAGRSANDQLVMVRSYLLLADIEVESDPERAIVLLNEGWTLAIEASLDRLATYFPHILGLAHLNLQEPDVAERFFAEGMEAANDVGALSMLCANYVGRAEARLFRNDIDGAIEDLKTGIRLALKTGAGRYLLWAAVVSCRTSAAEHGSGAQVRHLLALTLSHPAADQDARDKAAATWRALFDDDAPQPAVAERVAGFDEVAEKSLQALSSRRQR